jgi:hypothetical protein
MTPPEGREADEVMSEIPAPGGTPTKRNSREALAALKQRWVDAGAAALALTAPGLQARMYGCPLCLRAAPSAATFTFEHVPPRSVGGRRRCLTCRDCNSLAGAKLDHHVKAGAESREIANGTRDVPVTVTLREHGHRISARIRRTDQGYEMAGVREKSDERAHTAFFSTLDEIAARGGTDWSLQLNWKTRYNPEAERISWLRTGFLVAFSVLGYRYAYHNALRAVRRQIREPGTKILPPFLVSADGAPPEARAIAFVRRPEPLRGSIMVQCGSRVVVLPGLTNDEHEHARVLGALGSEPARGRIDGLSADWPREPQYRLDLEPHLAAAIRREQFRAVVSEASEEVDQD